MKHDELEVCYGPGEPQKFREVRSIRFLSGTGVDVHELDMRALKDLAELPTYERPGRFPPCFTSKCHQCRFKMYCLNAKE
jgi:hypothetical protein